MTEQDGTTTTYPYATLPYPYFSLYPTTIRARVTTVAGLGQGPAFEDVGGLQTFSPDVAQSIATNLAAMIWVLTGAGTYTAYSPGSYEVNFGEPSITAPGYPSNATAPGTYVLAAVTTIAPVDALSTGRPLDKIDLFVAQNKEQAAGLASPGGNYGVVLAPAAALPAEKKGVSPAIIAGIAAAAVAALLIFA
jgi:hypothetical protein